MGFSWSDVSDQLKRHRKKKRLTDENFNRNRKTNLRELEYTDKMIYSEMDSDPEVHLYIENSPVKTIDEIQKKSLKCLKYNTKKMELLVGL